MTVLFSMFLYLNGWFFEQNQQYSIYRSQLISGLNAQAHAQEVWCNGGCGGDGFLCVFCGFMANDDGYGT